MCVCVCAWDKEIWKYGERKVSIEESTTLDMVCGGEGYSGWCW